MGTPVVATRVGGVPEIVHDDENGLLVEPGDPAALAAALRAYLADEPLRARLRAAAAPSVERFSAELSMGARGILAEAACVNRECCSSGEPATAPLGSQRRKWDALGTELDYRVLASAATGLGVDITFPAGAVRTNAVDGPRFYLALPVRIAHELRTFRPDAVICPVSVRDGRRAARRRAARRARR